MGVIEEVIKGILIEIDWMIIAFVMIAQSSYFFMLLLSTIKLKHYQRTELVQKVIELDQDDYAPPVSLIIPSYNEAEVIQDSVSGFLGLDYPDYNVIVVNDGSTDHSLETLISAFKLIEIEAIYQSDIPTKPIRGIYRSLRYPNLMVVDKDNGGKADSINAGINVSQEPFFCVVDADSIIENDALTKLISPFISHRQEVVATGGIVLLSNGCKIKSGRIVEKKIPKNFWAKIQLSDYLRAFLIGRMAWDSLNSLLIIAGAFGMFKKSAVVEVGGYATDTVGEDMEITVRLHRHRYENKKDWKITFVPDTACWTQAPYVGNDLKKQRNRWHRGLIETLLRHRKMIFNPRYGSVGMLAIPYFIIIEIIGPLIGFAGLFLLPISIWLGLFDVWFTLIFLSILYVFNFLMTFSSLIIESYLLKRYDKFRTIIYVSTFSFIETLILRTLNFIWKTQAVLQVKTKKHAWDKLQRTKF